MIAFLITFVIVALVVAHLAGGATRHVQHRRRGLRPRLGYVYGRGWFASAAVPGTGFRVSHRI